MPNYVKFMKDILSKKRRLREFEIVALTEGCTTMLKNRLPPKLIDLGSFTIPCSIGNHGLGKALYNLGVSINVMPMSVFRKLGIGKARPTAVTIQLTDRSYVHAEDKEVPIILGRPFLATGRTLIDVQEDEECHALEYVDDIIQEEFAEHMNHNSDANSVE
ncbi:uncharacterized protein LOC105786925 [Gossypium raimondii]|uniref:uncharacterized protein LOC105786925 n=1 Tax=Gossypium raimondii TaxID=29730 RepID=UPI00063AD548|nr:uncharacterized protein LOC105786925 [Gossypium raimondii]